jgi:hypothetical protein
VSKAKRAFIASLAEKVSRDEDNRYDLLVAAAPSKLIAHFRNSLSGTMLAKLQTCINKDLTKIPDHELAPHLPILFARRAKAS